MTVPLTFGNGYNISKWYTGINLYLVEGIIVTLKVKVNVGSEAACQTLQLTIIYSPCAVYLPINLSTKTQEYG